MVVRMGQGKLSEGIIWKVDLPTIANPAEIRVELKSLLNS